MTLGEKIKTPDELEFDWKWNIYHLTDTFFIGQYARALWISIGRQGFFYIPLSLILPYIGGQTGRFRVQSAADFPAAAFVGMLQR